MTTTITPRIGDTRIKIKIEGDLPIQRNGWQKTVISTIGGVKYKLTIKNIACSLAGCRCDAEIIKAVKIGK